MFFRVSCIVLFVLVGWNSVAQIATLAGDEVSLVAVQSQSVISVTVAGNSDSSPVNGDGVIDLQPPFEPFGTARLTELQLNVVEGLSISFLGGLVSISSSPNSIMMTLVTAGNAGAVNGANQFDQFGNEAELSGVINIFDPFGLIGGSMNLDLSTIPPSQFDMLGVQLAESDNVLTVSASFDVEVPITDTITATVSGTVVLNGQLPKMVIGDVNCDGVVDLLDVGPFIDVLINGPYAFKADINMDGAVDLLDVQPFVVLLTGP